jgi:hypothetical protein
MMNYKPLFDPNSKENSNEHIIEINKQIAKAIKNAWKMMKLSAQMKSLKENEIDQKFREVVSTIFLCSP